MQEPGPSITDRLRYRFDSTISKGAIAVVGWLAAATFAVIILAGAILAFFVEIDGARPSFVEGFWVSLLRTLDPGTMGGDLGWGFRITSLIVTFAGLFIVATLIGLISSGIDQKLEGIRKGRTEVLETGHTLILGWSPKLFTVLSELVIANESEKRSSIVVMAPRDKIEMEDEIREHLGQTKTRIVCRTGDPASGADLALVHPLRAKSVIVLSPDQDDAPDARVVKAVLALSRLDPGFTTLRVVAELLDPRHEQALGSATHGRVLTVISEAVIARITAQVCRVSGLSAVYQDLLDFGGDEIYWYADEHLAGRTFGELLLSFEKSSVLGIAHADGSIELKPSMDTRLSKDDQVVVVAEDDSAIKWEPVAVADRPSAPAGDGVDKAAERTLILGWNRLGEHVVKELDRSVSAGSQILIAWDPSIGTDAHLPEGLVNLSVESVDADINDPQQLENILTRQSFDHVMILCYRGDVDTHDAEARTLLTLVQLRQILAAQPGPAPTIVTELLDVRDVELAQAANPDDYIVSLSLTSLMLAQLSENPALVKVFDELFDPDGCELSLAPVSAYVPPGEHRFADLVAAARARGEVALGYRLASRDNQAARVQLNPSKSEPVLLDANDQVIVLR